LALGAAAACARPHAAGAQTAVDRLRAAGPATEDAANVYYAIKTGMFERVGLGVEMIPTASGSAAVAAVLGGTYELARTSLLGVFAGHLRGLPLTIVTPNSVYRADAPSALLQIAADAPYKNGADLNGKTVAVAALNDLNALATRVWMDKHGGDWRSLKFVELPNSALEAALVQHRIDAAVMLSPSLDASLAAGTTKTLGDGWGSIGSAFLVGAWVAHSGWAAAHADALHRYNRVLIDSTAYVASHPAETAPLVAEFTKIDLANVTKMHRTYNPMRLDVGLVQPVIDVAAKYGSIERAFPAREVVWAG
jgi:NitT/TauT family transport system substrate-binding protein